MKNIKFRAWDKINGEMIPWNRLLNGYNLRNVFMGPEMSGLILMQFTGLEDKNGTQIYEGDIVETVWNGEVFAGVVVYDLSEVDFKVTDGKEEYGRNFQYLAGNDENEVIGNVYQNKGLLEVRE